MAMLSFHRMSCLLFFRRQISCYHSSQIELLVSWMIGRKHYSCLILWIYLLAFRQVNGKPLIIVRHLWVMPLVSRIPYRVQACNWRGTWLQTSCLLSSFWEDWALSTLKCHLHSEQESWVCCTQPLNSASSILRGTCSRHLFSQDIRFPWAVYALFAFLSSTTQVWAWRRASR